VRLEAVEKIAEAINAIGSDYMKMVWLQMLRTTKKARERLFQYLEQITCSLRTL
jgi:hypothetical protein